MLKNYIIIGWRNLVRAFGFSAINVFGLSVGMCVAMLIGLWVYDELSFNESFPNHDRITQVYHNITLGEDQFATSGVGYPYGGALKSTYAEIEDVCTSSGEGDHILALDDVKMTEKGLFVDPSFLKIFSVKLLEGSADALNKVHSIVLSKSLARKLFSDQSVVGKMLKFDNQEQLMVNGVFEDFPPNSQFAAVHLLVPIEYMFAANPGDWKSRDSWESYAFDCYALLKPGTSAPQLSSKLEQLLLEKSSKEGKAMNPEGFLFAMNDWHLNVYFNDGSGDPPRMQYVWMFGTIGVFVLALACINFMNLSTARSEMRSKEVGVRKVMGSARRQLIRQFLSESLMIVMIGAFIALIIAWLALPVFNDVIGKQIGLPWNKPMFYVGIFSFVLLTALLAGSYPALYLSAFNPVQVLKGTFKAGRAATLPRKVMVVFQFTISILLIIGTIVVFLEIQHARNREVGFDRAGIIQMQVLTKDLANADYNALRAELISSGAVENMAKSDFPMTGAVAADASLSWEGKDPDVHPLIALNHCSHDFPATNGFQFVEGRDFSHDLASDSSAIIINEMAAELFGRDKAIGMKIKFFSGKERTVVGIIRDQIRWTPFSKQSPHIYYVSYEGMGHLTIRLNPNMPTAEALKKVEEVIHRHDPNSPFEYEFQDENYGKMFRDEERMGKLAAVFAVLAIAISCIGMFGLAAFAASQRIKEIGIRKILGASVFKLWGMLSLDFVLLVLVAMVLAFPISYYLMGSWLAQFEYRIDITWGIFALSGVLALLITLLTVSYQALRAAGANPVNSLRNN
ncbi:ABC transporter permease [Chryseolinea sp. T2]|uniref:ABC transporter permease n=1 Tax=Chryseolinea sp. T2 TaxID=3129255 RepID=UPI003077F316